MFFWLSTLLRTEKLTSMLLRPVARMPRFSDVWTRPGISALMTCTPFGTQVSRHTQRRVDSPSIGRSGTSRQGTQATGHVGIGRAQLTAEVGVHLRAERLQAIRVAGDDGRAHLAHDGVVEQAAVGTDETDVARAVENPPEAGCWRCLGPCGSPSRSARRAGR